jgi:hypothetical protein
MPVSRATHLRVGDGEVHVAQRVVQEAEVVVGEDAAT